MELFEKTVESREIYKGWVVTLKLDRVELPDGSLSSRELVQHPGGVCIAPVDEEGYTYLVEQFRYPFGRVLTELPAGKLEWQEDPDLAAVRELREETGFTAAEMRKVGEIYSSPGFCSERLHLYIATGLTRGSQQLDQGEFLNLVRMPLQEAVEMAVDGRLQDGKTRTLLLLCDRLLGRE